MHKGLVTKVGVDSNKIFVIPVLAPDLQWFDNTRRVKLGLEEYELDDLTHPVIFYAASHYEHKGFKYYLLSASEVLRKFDATFIVGGKGPLTPSLKEKVRKLGIDGRVIFTGWINNYHMPYILSNVVDICVSTSLVEQLPSYIMECMAAAKPIVATNVGGVLEIVLDGVNGYLVPPRNSNETAHRIIELLEEPEKAREMGEAGRKMVEQKLNMKESIKKLIETYAELCEA